MQWRPAEPLVNAGLRGIHNLSDAFFGFAMAITPISNILPLFWEKWFIFGKKANTVLMTK